MSWLWTLTKTGLCFVDKQPQGLEIPSWLKFQQLSHPAKCLPRGHTLAGSWGSQDAEPGPAAWHAVSGPQPSPPSCRPTAVSAPAGSPHFCGRCLMRNVCETRNPRDFRSGWPLTCSGLAFHSDLCFPFIVLKMAQ